MAARALSLGVNVVLDYGCWAREEREYFRTQAQTLGARVELHVLDMPLADLWRRLEGRNANLPPHTFPVTWAELEEWNTWFERPDHAELALYDSSRSTSPGSKR